MKRTGAHTKRFVFWILYYKIVYVTKIGSFNIEVFIRKGREAERTHGLTLLFPDVAKKYLHILYGLAEVFFYLLRSFELWQTQ